MREYPIIVTDRDSSRLRGLLGGQSPASFRDQGHLSQLQSELERALVLAADEVPAGVVTIDSMVRVVDLDSGKRSVLTLVLPQEADVAQRRISVLAPIGTALLGFRAGDDVEWVMPGGIRRLHIEHVIQPNQVAAIRRTRSARPDRYGPSGAH
jgi:regulator of nucleoside diphosphate kinase